MRKGSANTARGARRFIDEVVARVRRAGATGENVMRFDSGFWSKDTIASLGRLGVRYTMILQVDFRIAYEAFEHIDNGVRSVAHVRVDPSAPAAIRRVEGEP